MGYSRFGFWRAVAVAALGMVWAFDAVASSEGCRAVTGFAIEGRPEAGATAQGSISTTTGVRAFPTPTFSSAFFCSPTSGDAEQNTGDRGAILNFDIGTGFRVRTAALASGGSSVNAYANMFAFLELNFRVTSASGTAETVDVTFHSLYSFGTIQSEVSSTGYAENAFTVGHHVRRNESLASRTEWSSAPIIGPGSSGTTSLSSTDVPVVANAVGYNVFSTTIILTSTAASGPATMESPAPGTGTASMDVLWTFAVDVPDGYEIEFDYEDLLGLSAPTLGTLHGVPVPAPLWLLSGALGTLFLRRRRAVAQ